ncbi:hypothetical protein [Brevundimonas sp.]|uniref:hypothetical protein n=1 Tax=Brevundimonas sp. TaxID=1871086 RepID=UPI002ABD01A6|nr:hypothetical protein [Brevundimonas sp.]MDZ4363993.1 hypothetical protein [Brevundimonas sp.]
MTQVLCGNDLGWVERVLDRCETRYLNEAGILATALDGEGRLSDPTPLLADFGDVLPFMSRLGRTEFVDRQMALARPLLSDALYAQGGRLRLFDNHDWLLGLLELHAVTGDRSLLDLAAEGARTLIRRFFVDDLLTDGTAYWKDPRSWLSPASPFNGGYIELWIELHELTGDAVFLAASQRLAARWNRTPGFEAHGVLEKIFSARSTTLNRLAGRGARMQALLFKDNTNFVWSMLALHGATQDPAWARMIQRWIEGFRDHFLNWGQVWLWLDRAMQGRDVSLKAAFSSIDLLCDIHAAGVSDSALPIARIVADSWLPLAWSNGLFPEHPGGRRDHLDANVDMAVALLKLAGLTGHQPYAEAAARAAEGVVRHHEGPHGLVMAVDPDGQVVDPRIIVKYQALALKLALAPRAADDLWADRTLMTLLRDR